MHKEFRLNIGTELLRTLVAVADLRSYKRAAAQLGLSQPTVSGHMRRLQEQLAVELFDKRVPGVRLTAAGEMTVTRARQLLEIHDDILDGIAVATPARGTPVLHVGCSHDLRCGPLVTLVADLRQNFPGARVVSHKGTAESLLERVRTGELHLCMVATAEQQPDARMSRREPLVWIGNGHAPPDEQDGLPVVAPPVGMLARDAMFDVLSAHGVAHTTTFQAMDMDGAIEAVRAGLGYTALMASLVANGNAAGGNGINITSGRDRLPPMPVVYWQTMVAPAAEAPLHDMCAFLCERIETLMPEAAGAEP